MSPSISFRFRLVLAVFLALISTAPVRAQSKIAVVVAAGKAEVPYNLRAPQNDAVLIAQLLVGRFGFAPGNVLVVGLSPSRRRELTEFGNFQFGPERADKRAIDQALDWLEQRNRSTKDRLVIYYSGHGTTVQSQARDAVNGLENQALAPDFAIRPEDLITDVALARRLNTLRSQRLLVVADACFAGGLLRSDAQIGAPEVFPFDGFKDVRPLLGPPVPSPSLQPRGAARKQTLFQLSAIKRPFLAPCLLDETSNTRRWGATGPSFSPFTLALCRLAWRTPGDLTWNALRSPAKPLAMSREFTQLYRILGAGAANPVCYAAGGEATPLGATPDFDLSRYLSGLRRINRPAPLGDFVLAPLRGSSSGAPATLGFDLSRFKPARTTYFRTVWN